MRKHTQQHRALVWKGLRILIDRVGTNTIMSRNIESLRGITLGFNKSGPRIEVKSRVVTCEKTYSTPSLCLSPMAFRPSLCLSPRASRPSFPMEFPISRLVG